MVTTKANPGLLRFATRVTRRHGELFVAHLRGKEWREFAYLALSSSGVMEWPRDDEDDSPAKAQYMELEDEILDSTFELAEEALAAAFVAAATRVLRRERDRQPEGAMRKAPHDVDLARGARYRGGLHARSPRLPVYVFHDALTDEPRCINAMHIATFIQNPHGNGKGTLITFASGDTCTVEDDFDDVFTTICGTYVDG